ncbi:MAG: 6-bladed beta-propeller [Bacteroidetes bacterium]|nr:MAG: 6-bladed beta-propeller [Bacteroidota bacterium]
MQRRKFIKSASGLLLAVPLGISVFDFEKAVFTKDLIVGHNDHRYKVDMTWGNLDPEKIPVKDCHEMVIDSRGRIVLLTNHTKNNVIIYNKDGEVVKTWGTEFPGAHGLTLKDEGGEDMLYITDTERHEVIKTTIDGKIVKIFPYPADFEPYSEASRYVPTETAIAENGDIYVADGYGGQYILHYNAKGELLNTFGGPGLEDDKFNNAHGICIDTRTKEDSLLITARQQNKLKRFTMEGEWLENIDLPGAYICRPVVKGENVYLATIWSGDGASNTGFISVLDKDNQLVSAPGGSTPQYVDDKLDPVYQTLKLFKHPHDVCVDEDENLYVAQWNAGNVYPFKMTRI